VINQNQENIYGQESYYNAKNEFVKTDSIKQGASNWFRVYNTTKNKI